MLRNLQIFAKRIPRSRNLVKNFSKPKFRTYLSSSYSCEDAWNRRLELPYMKKINVSDMFYELENQFLHFGKANGIDIDLFANAVNDSDHLDEVEDVLHKLRLSPEAKSLLPSTQHAFIRHMLANDKVEDLLRILDDRLNYGVFMDDYSCILLLNTFLNEKNFKDAARVATIQMLQEDFSNPIVRFMSLYACLKYNLDPVSWVNEEVESKDEDDDEEIKVRVRYIRNFYFDDHFDLRNPSHLVGKTLWMIGSEMPDALGDTCKLIGFCLHNKWEKLENLIQLLLESKKNQAAYKGCISIMNNILNDFKQKTEKESHGEIEKVQQLVNKLNNSGLLSEDDFVKIVEERMLHAIKEHEEEIIQNQIKTYVEWEKLRETLVGEHVEKLKREKALAQIEVAKRELAEKEEELFFFDNEDELELVIESKNVPRKIQWKGKIKKKRAVDTEYIPPEIEKRRET